jgi:hypothetical protein
MNCSGTDLTRTLNLAPSHQESERILYDCSRETADRHDGRIPMLAILLFHNPIQEPADPDSPLSGFHPRRVEILLFRYACRKASELSDLMQMNKFRCNLVSSMRSLDLAPTLKYK